MKSLFNLSITSFTEQHLYLQPLPLKFLCSICFLFMLPVLSPAQCTLSNGAANTALWTGASNSDWCNAANWACGKIPDESVNVIIPGDSKNMPVVSCAVSFNANAANLDVQEGATLTIPANRTLNITGNFMNEQEERYVLNGRVNFSGSNQLIPGFTYNNLTVSGGGVKTMAGNALVNGALILTRGIIAAGNTNMITVGYKGIVTAGYNQSYINGPLKRLTNASGTYNFPVGSDDVVREVLISPEEEKEGAYMVSYHHSTVPDNGVFGCANLMANEAKEFWDVSRINNTPNALVQINYEGLTGAESWSNKLNPTEISAVALIENNKGSWIFKGDAAAGLEMIESIPPVSNGQLGIKLESDFSHFTFGYGYKTILPIHLISFSAKLLGTASQLSWSIEQGADIVTTELQHSTDQKHFDKLTTVEAANGRGFNYTHPLHTPGPHYYRLMMSDKARNVCYSRTMTVMLSDYHTTIKGLKATQVRYEAVVKLESAVMQAAGVNLYDMAGHLVSKQSVTLQQGENNVPVGTTTVRPGIYNLFVQTKDGVSACLRFIKE